MSLPSGKKLFVERVEFELIERMNSLTGIRRLLDAEKGSQLQMLFGSHVDVKPQTLDTLRSRKDIENVLMPLFWDEMLTPEVRLLEVKSRLVVGLPKGVSAAASCVLEGTENTIKALHAAPFRIDGTQRGIFDDVAVFDVPKWMVHTDDGSLDLTPIERFLSLGSTISFFFPSPQHQRWYTFAKRHTLPPTIKCSKKLSVVCNVAISPEITSIVFGVDKASANPV